MPARPFLPGPVLSFFSQISLFFDFPAVMLCLADLLLFCIFFHPDAPVSALLWVNLSAFLFEEELNSCILEKSHPVSKDRGTPTFLPLFPFLPLLDPMRHRVCKHIAIPNFNKEKTPLFPSFAASIFAFELFPPSWRWMKNPSCGSQIVLRIAAPRLVLKELWALMIILFFAFPHLRNQATSFLPPS